MNPKQLIDAAFAFAKQVAAVDCKPRAIQFSIDGLVYTSVKLPAGVGLELWPRVVALLGSGLTRGLATGEGEVDLSAFVRVADKAMKDGLLPLVRDLLVRMQCNKLFTTGQPGLVNDDFDEHFAGEYAHLGKVCVLALAHNLRGPTYGAH